MSKPDHLVVVGEIEIVAEWNVHFLLEPVVGANGASELVHLLWCKLLAGIDEHDAGASVVRRLNIHKARARI
eukprot:CAMPEP_0202046214 /NCGR_PEP_ID=MMETSP0963-20130614/1161_1 /ASSEMBLY_ACC=CAM_ASM_000494 /TAXON_ID=4773 /ORGANISM="Schizochytrium aggregatum, Strain ATCC28209" /LENGTH=71 /DNA_ID=CAMNT_0048610847 /DNA_START=303 /DNA_END=518 /DNA_ORIENTATION=+